LFLALFAVFIAVYFAYAKSKISPKGWGAMRYPQLLLGMIAIFTYVGVEVTIQSNLGELLKGVTNIVNNTNAIGLPVLNDAQI
jgi:hypothetical protein